jgi:hypothetical protein
MYQAGSAPVEYAQQPTNDQYDCNYIKYTSHDIALLSY